jgi:transcription elongation factor GreA
MLRRARVIDEADIATDVVSLGSRVLLKDIEEGLELEFVIVGTAEADPRSGKISVESPVGRAILGQANGQVVEVKVPAGKLQYQILDICR